MDISLRRFLYLDSVGIHSLYTQLRDFNERERRTTNQKNKSISGKGRLGFKVLAGIFGGTSETEMSHTRDSKMLTEQILVKEFFSVKPFSPSVYYSTDLFPEEPFDPPDPYRYPILLAILDSLSE